MSEPTAVISLLMKLSRCASTVSQAYINGQLHRTDENTRDIELLRQLRMISPGIRDSFQLRGSFREFLNKALNTQRLFAIGSNVGEYFSRLGDLIDGYAEAFHEARDSDCERYEMEIREAISDIADAIDDELTVLQAQIATRFGAVTTIAEKRRQNTHYQDRTQKLVLLLERFHFSDLGEQLAGNDDLALAFRSLLEERIPSFRQALIAILKQLHQYMFEFRKIEARAKRVRAFALYLSRHQDWQPADWDDHASPPEWVLHAQPLSVTGHPDVTMEEQEPGLRDIALAIPRVAGMRAITRPPGVADDNDDVAPEVFIAQPLIKMALEGYFADAGVSADGLSARRWWSGHPSLMADVREDLWLLRVMGEFERRGKGGQWRLTTISEPVPGFDGNLFIRDLELARRDT